MFARRQNNNGNGVNINTSFYTSYSDTSLLSVGGWNRNLSIKLQPAVGKDSTGVTQYATEISQQINTSIREENAIALFEGFNKEIKPAIENSTEAKVTISIGNNENRKALSIYYDGKDAYLEIATALNEDGVTNEENVLRHKFNKKSFMTGYNYITGAGTEVPVEADLYNFMKKIEGCQSLVPMTAHSINYSNANKALYRNNNQNTSYGSGNNNYSAPTNTYSGDMSDFLPMS
jgi:hypothetical protein